MAVLALAVVLSALAQGRGQPLPAQRGDLLPGPAIATALLKGGTAPLTLAPARPGTNVLVVAPPNSGAHTVVARLVCGCDPRPVITRLRSPRHDGTFSGTIPVPAAGTWYAYLTVDGTPAASPAALTVGVPAAAGAPVQNVLAIADLSGPGAARCRQYMVGLELALGRLNASGGVSGGRKVAPLALDDAGSASTAASLANRALSNHPLALLPCGTGAEPAIAAAARRGVPSIVGDPATGPVPALRTFRLAADPYADGYALGQAITANVLPVSAPTARSVQVVVGEDAQGARRLAGLRAALAGSKVRIRLTPTITTLDRRSTVALVLDGHDSQAAGFEAALRHLPATGAPAPVLLSERLLGEGFIDGAGNAGRLGVVQGTSSVSVDSRDALTLTQAIPGLFPGQGASMESLRGYVAGLTFVYGVGAGTSATALAAKLGRPAPFTDALAAPWRSDAPAAGSPRLGLFAPTFLSANLIPPSQGGEAYSGAYFANGAWTRPSSTLFGPSLQSPVPPL
jgi:hypothetical protein